jgi:hypothetical protein
VFDVQGDWSPVVSGEATAVEKSTGCLMLDAGEEKAKAGDCTNWRWRVLYVKVVKAVRNVVGVPKGVPKMTKPEGGRGPIKALLNGWRRV